MVVQFVMVWWLLYAVHRAVFEVRRICFNRRVRRGVSGDVRCLHMSVGLKIGEFWVGGESYACVIVLHPASRMQVCTYPRCHIH